MVKDGISPYVAFSFLVNACMGIGFLALPYSSLRFGLIASLIVTILLGILATLSALWIATTLSLAWALSRSNKLHADSDVTARVPIATKSERGDRDKDDDQFEIGHSMQMSYVKLIGMLFGDGLQNVTMSALAFVLVISMWSFAAIFASSMAAIVPAPFIGGTCDVYDDWEDDTCASRYYLYLAIFALMMSLLSLAHLAEQQKFQLAMTLCRICLVIAIVGDCMRIATMEEAPPHPGMRQEEASHIVPVGGRSSVAHYDPDRWPSVPSPLQTNAWRGCHHIALATAALTVHMVIPDAVHDLTDKRKTLLPTLGSALAFCTFVYCIISIAVVMTFGKWTRPVCTLNWVNYTAGEPTASAFAMTFRTVVILIPVLDVTAAYPILSQSLAANVSSVLWPTSTERSTWYLRLLCSLIPLIGASFVYNAAQTLGWCGVLLVPFVFILPQLLLEKAERLCVSEFGEKKVHASVYWRWYCNRNLVIGGLCFGSVLSVVSFFEVLGG